MTSYRARACARVTTTLDNLRPAKLLGPEQAQIRHVADTLLFCADLPNDASARTEFAGVDALLEHLVACGRWRRLAVRGGGRHVGARRVGLRAERRQGRSLRHLPSGPGP
jgi:hypothetical protein